MESLDRLRGLHQDLIAFTNTRLANVERLWHELEASIQDFRELLDKSIPDTEPRVTISDNKLSIGEDEFSLSQNLKDIGHAVSSTLGLQNDQDGIKLIVQTKGTDIEGGQELVQDVVCGYHDRRDLLLQNLRIVLQESVGRVEDDGFQAQFQDYLRTMLSIGTGQSNSGSIYVRKCLQAMKGVEERQKAVNDALQGQQMISGAHSGAAQSLEFQKSSLLRQHEALGSIVNCLFRQPYSTVDDVRELLKVPSRFEQFDIFLLHYLPSFAAAFRQYGGPDHSSNRSDADLINGVMKRLEPAAHLSGLQSFYAVLRIWWIVEYGGWFRESESQDEEVVRLSEDLKKTLKDNALEQLLALCSTMNFQAARQPARHAIVSLLLSENPSLSIDQDSTSDYFKSLLMESLETFAEAWIVNMPDSIRELKSEEDQQRLLHLMAVHDGLDQNSESESHGRLHLECLMVLISFAFENRSIAAEEIFWQDLEGNLFGFLQWASRRQTVPRASAFCEMLCAISEGPVCAEAAHKFLLGDVSTAGSGRGRRYPSTSYQQIFAELELYSRKVHERSAIGHAPHLRTAQPTDMNEVESPIMLSCYLRLLAHMCRQTRLARDLFFAQSANMIHTLFMLSSGPIPSYLRSTVFITLDALLTDKSASIAADMWKLLDRWVASGTSAVTAIPPSTDQNLSLSKRTMRTTFNSVATAFDQTDSFLVLLCHLMSPSPDESAGGSMLPFPADLGATYRSPGIAPFVDFVIGQVFSRVSSDTNDLAQSRVLILHCLQFIAECLESFNEDYVTVLGRNTQSVAELSPGSAISTDAYALVHPFARTMRWLYNGEVYRNLLQATSIDIDEMVSAKAEPTMSSSLKRGLDVLILILDLEPTYLDIVRPFVAERARDGENIPTSCDYFEETISARPKLIHDLCAYSAADDDVLVYKALDLLERLSSSKKLNQHYGRSDSYERGTKRVIDMLGPNANTDFLPISAALCQHLAVDERELEEGYDSLGYEIKDIILSFFTKCLGSQPHLPTVAHLLLGFTRVSERLDLEPGGPLDQGNAVFNAILSLAQDYPEGLEDGKQSWLLHIKSLCMSVLRALWSDSISSPITISQMRRYKFLQGQFSGQELVSRHTLWDGCPTTDPLFWFDKHAEGHVAFLDYRSSIYALAAAEIKAAHESGQLSWQKQCFATLLGKSSGLDGLQMTHANIYELFDFVDLDISADMSLPPLKYFSRIDFSEYMLEATEYAASLYHLDGIRELLRHEIRNRVSNPANKPTAEEEEELTGEADLILSILRARNRHFRVQRARGIAIHHWVQVIIVTLAHSPMEASQKVQFILQLLQTILPRFDNFILNSVDESFELARAADAMVFSLSQLSPEQSSVGLANIITDRLFQLFRICVEGITNSESSTAQRNLLYNICSQYLTRVSSPSETDRRTRSKCLDSVRSAGPTLLSVLSDDAEDGIDACKPAALNLLGQLASLARDGKSSFVIDAVTRSNTLEILIDPINYLATEFQNTKPAARKYLLVVLDARTLFLLQIARTKQGATAVLDAGLMQVIRDSMIFRADPDLGLELNNPTALLTYYAIISSLLRLLVTTFISRGTQNEQCLALIRTFLAEYRANMVGLFKRASGASTLGVKTNKDTEKVLKEIVRCYTSLAVMSGFVNREEEAGLDGRSGANMGRDARGIVGGFS